MVETKSAAEAAAKWQRNAGAAAPEYERGVKSPKKSWASEAAKAESAYEQGVQASISRKGYSKGVRAAGDPAWSRGATTLGVERYPRGVAENADKYQSKMDRVISAIQSVSLKPRGARGDPSNIERVRQIADVLHKLKTGGGTSTKST